LGVIRNLAVIDVMVASGVGLHPNPLGVARQLAVSHAQAQQVFVRADGDPCPDAVAISVVVGKFSAGDRDVENIS
jgi:hypothetical protein